MTRSEEVVVLWNKSEMQCSAFIAILEPQNICFFSLFFLLPSGSETGPLVFIFLVSSSVVDINYCFISLLYLNKKQLWKGAVCVRVWVWAVNTKTGPSPRCYQIFHIFLEDIWIKL